MKYRKLAGTEIKVSEVSLGCWTLGGLNWVNGIPNGWANVDEAEAIAAIHHAIDEGVNHFDNADVYGNGRAERLLAKAIDGKDKNLIIASKVGHFPGTAAHAYEPAHIRHQCEQSLINLKREVIDIYYFHHGDFGENDLYLDDAVAMMNRLRDEGKIRLIGLSAYSCNDFTRLVPKVKPNVLQSFANALDDQFVRPGMPVQRLMKEHNISFVAFSPLAQGVLLDKYKPEKPPQFDEGDHRRGKDRFSKEGLEKLQPKLAKIKERYGGSVTELARVALQYLLGHDVVGCVIPGFRNLKQVKINLEASINSLTAEDIAYIRKVFNE